MFTLLGIGGGKLIADSGLFNKFHILEEKNLDISMTIEHSLGGLYCGTVKDRKCYLGFGKKYDEDDELMGYIASFDI